MKKIAKPVVFVQGDVEFYRQNKYAQNLLIKALSEGVTDPYELQKMAGLSKVTDVYRSLDKLALRKEYHVALQNAGISLDYIVGGIKKITDSSNSEKIKLAALQTLLKSMGLDRYEKEEAGGKNWEEVVLNAMAKEAETKRLGDGKTIEGEFEEVKDYDVKVPPTPEDEKKRQDKEKKIGKELYD